MKLEDQIKVYPPVTCCRCKRRHPGFVDVCRCNHDMRICCKREPCKSCGLPVPVKELYPFPGHKADCELLGELIGPYQQVTRFLNLCGELGIHVDADQEEPGGLSQYQPNKVLPERVRKIDISGALFYFDPHSGVFLGVESNETGNFEPRNR